MNKDKTVANFGEGFCSKVAMCVKKYSDLWELSKVEQIEHYTWSCLFKCYSEKHGLCVLKIAEIVDREWLVLKEYNGKGFCKIYEASLADGVLLVEYIDGEQLQNRPDAYERIELFCTAFNGLHIKPKAIDECQNYTNWIDNICEYIVSWEGCAELVAKIKKAKNIYSELCKNYSCEMLLHNDLYHSNIILSSGDSSEYKCNFIDPREAVIGVALLDLPYFVLYEHNNCDMELQYIISLLSRKLNIPIYDIWASLYVVLCVDICYEVKSGGKPSLRILNIVEKHFDEIASAFGEV